MDGSDDGDTTHRQRYGAVSPTLQLSFSHQQAHSGMPRRVRRVVVRRQASTYPPNIQYGVSAAARPMEAPSPRDSSGVIMGISSTSAGW